MTKFMAIHTKETLEQIKAHILESRNGLRFIPDIDTALVAIDYEIDLMCLEEAESAKRPRNPELEAMAQDAQELFELGFEFCRKHRAA